MIDTIKFRAPLSEALLNAVVAKYKDTQALNRPYILEKIQTRFGRFTIKIYPSEGYIEMELSPSKYMRGHNVVGTNNITKLLNGVMKMIYRHFSLLVTAVDRALYKQHGFTLLRVDLTASFIVESQAEVVNTMSLIRQHLLILNHNVVVHVTPEGTETIYIGKASSRSSVKFYNKYREMLHANKGKGKAAIAIKALPYYDDILKHAERVVRFEFTFRAPELKRRSLNSSLVWDANKVRILLQEKLCKLGLSSQLIAKLPTEVVGDLKGIKLIKYEQWLDGINLRKTLLPATFTRYRKYFLTFGLDIARTRVQAPQGAALTRRLSVAKMRMGYPKRFVETGAVFR